MKLGICVGACFETGYLGGTGTNTQTLWVESLTVLLHNLLPTTFRLDSALGTTVCCLTGVACP